MKQIYIVYLLHELCLVVTYWHMQISSSIASIFVHFRYDCYFKVSLLKFVRK